MKKIIALLLCIFLIIPQVFAGGTKEEKGRNIGGAVGTLAGGAAGGAATGALVGSVVPGIGTAVGIILGGIGGGAIGYFGGLPLGEAIGSAIGKSLDSSYDYDPVFEITSRFDFAPAEDSVELLFPAIEVADKMDFSELQADSKMVVVGNMISAEIDLTPAVIVESDDIPEADVTIPVIVQIFTPEKGKVNITYASSNGFNNIGEFESDAESITYYGQIRSSAETKQIRFIIESTEDVNTCTIQFRVYFGATGNRILVSEDSNAATTVQLVFVDNRQVNALPK